MKIGILIVIFTLIFNPLPAQTDTTIVTLEQLIEEAVRNNPEYLSAQKRVQAEEAQIPQAGSLPDPTLGLGLMNMPVNSFDFNQEPMTGKKISLMQMFPFPGKLGLKEDIAEYQADVTRFQVEELKNNLIKNVKTTYYDLFNIEKSLEIVEKNKSLLQQFIRVAETKYSVGKGLQQDVLKAQVELSKLNDKLITLEQKRKSLVFKLNKLLNRDIRQPIGRLAEVERSSVDVTQEGLVEMGAENRPLLKSWDAVIAKSKSAHKLAKKSYLPDFGLGVAYTQRDDLQSGMKMYDFFSAEISINLPLYFYRKQSKKVQETRLVVSSMEEKYIDVKNEVALQIENAYTELEKNAQLIDLYRTGIIPQASQSLNSAMSGYQVDKVDFLTLLNNQMTLFNYEMQYYRVLTDHEKSIAGLEAAVGTLFHSNEN